MSSHDSEIRAIIGDDDAYLAYEDRGQEVRVRPEWRVRKGKDLLARAVGMKSSNKLHILDVTMGLASDAVHLFRLGAHLEAVERDHRVADVVEWWLNKNTIPIDVHRGDAAVWLASQQRRFDVIYMDPMFSTSEKTAKARKEMEVLRTIEAALPADVINEVELLNEARKWASRVVVKRALKASPVSVAEKPSFQIAGRLIRYDIYK